MIKNICKHLLNRWKKNLWITLELLLVFCLTWYMVDYFFVLGYNKSLSSHRDLAHTYMVNIGSLPQNHEDYHAEDDEPAARYANYLRVINLLRDNPDVESVALASDYSALSALGALNEGRYRSVTDTTVVAETQVIRFVADEDYLKVFRHSKANGKTLVSTRDYDWNDPANILISRMMEEKLFPGESAYDKRIEAVDQPGVQYRVIDVLDDIKHFNYLRPYGVVYLPERLNETNLGGKIITIRSRDGLSEAQFMATFKKEMSTRLRVGNYYLGGLNSLAQMAEDTDYRAGKTNEIRMSTALLLFLLVNILLCVLGTFWYRVNVRRGEIGIRRAMGSDLVGIRKLFMLEGLLLLTIIVVPALLIEVQFIFSGVITTLGQDVKSYGSYLPDSMGLRFLITNILTWCILAVMVLLGIWYPTRQASRMSPVDALRD
ncbi:FtsX-like permease family protein [Parabacteroides sp. PF5-6]|uniref:ABC transporter permease n=1 Tax=Parabacteroides sp. PF5-6 TaxID=1742403 RepID=UPI002405CE78|nr:FtsX-like permease family protein [Parabacteroides sp. PF5-6]MDF9829409.1 putative ABC transport system permease protein [Parabacteroides sp. PF5-6]